jgi:hypothetical protein
MFSKNIPEDDPENPPNTEHNDQTDNNEKPLETGNQSKPAFDFSDEDELDQVRKALQDLDAVKNVPVQPGEFENTDQNLEPDTNDPGTRINANNADESLQATGGLANTPPFVVDELLDFGEGNETLADKLQKGWIQPETLRLIINDSMSDAEISEVATELGVDWRTTPGNTNSEKLDFLVDYFNKIADSHDEDGGVNLRKTQPLSGNKKKDWEDSDNRIQALQESLNIPGAPKVEEKQSFLSRITDDFTQASPLIRWTTFGLGVLALLLIFSIFYVLVIGQKASPPQATPVAPIHPYPQNVRLPGGWTIDLKIGSVQQGSWNPSGAEWLEGTEVCRLISLPWNAQLDAVYQTIKPGDDILLTMSNRDLLGYKIESTKIISPTELGQLTTRDSPCLIVVLTQPGTEQRQAIIASPSYTDNSTEATVTVTSVAPANTKTP